MTTVSYNTAVKKWPLDDVERQVVVQDLREELWKLWHEAEGSWDTTAWILVHEMGAFARSSEQAAHFAAQADAMLADPRYRGAAAAIGVTMTDNLDDSDEVRQLVVARVNPRDP